MIDDKTFSNRGTSMDELCVILPVYNEKRSVETVLHEWKRVLGACGINYRFLICEDGSTDGTKELLARLRQRYRFSLNQKPRRRGYGPAVIDGIQASPAIYTLCIDADGQCDPQDFRKFWDNRFRADVIVGWRKSRADGLQRRVFSAVFSLVFQLCFAAGVHDPSAPFVLFRTAVILPHLPYLTYLREGFWWGFAGMCSKKRLAILELPIHHRPRLSGATQVYAPTQIPSIALRNVIGLLLLKFAK